MTSRLAALAALTVAAALATGCAEPGPASANAAAREAPVYRTGSNIPVRAQAMTQEERERRADEDRRLLQQMQATGAGSPRPN